MEPRNTATIMTVLGSLLVLVGFIVLIQQVDSYSPEPVPLALAPLMISGGGFLAVVGIATGIIIDQLRLNAKPKQIRDE